MSNANLTAQAKIALELGDARINVHLLNERVAQLEAQLAAATSELATLKSTATSVAPNATANRATNSLSSL